MEDPIVLMSINAAFYAFTVIFIAIALAYTIISLKICSNWSFGCFDLFTDCKNGRFKNFKDEQMPAMTQYSSPHDAVPMDVGQNAVAYNQELEHKQFAFVVDNMQ